MKKLLIIFSLTFFLQTNSFGITLSKALFEAYKNKTIRPTSKEVFTNPPSRSAKLRFAVRNKNNFFYPVDLKRKFKKYLELERFYA